MIAAYLMARSSRVHDAPSESETIRTNSFQVAQLYEASGKPDKAAEIRGFGAP